MKKSTKKEMKKNLLKRGKDSCDSDKPACNACSNGFYFLGFIGAAIYYLSTAAGFWMGVLGILKAMVWPAFLVFELLKFLSV
jgi:hypothetical protein